MNHQKAVCPICEEGKLHPKTDSNLVKYRGHRAMLDLHYSICDACGSEQAGADELRKNKRSTVEFRKKVDGLLTGSQVRSIRKILGLSQAEAARVFGGGPVAFSKYESDDVTQSEAMDKLLRLVSKLPAAVDLLRNPARLAPDCHQSVNESLNITSPFVQGRFLRQPNESGIAYGVDACKAGWFCVTMDPAGKVDAFTIERLEQLVAKASAEDRIFVDIPIGFSDGPEERLCDKEARSKLGPRRSSVFRTPVRHSLGAEDDEGAKKKNQKYAGKSLSKQTLAIIPKIKEIDALLRNNKKARAIVREVHPEVCFWALAGGRPMKHKKSKPEGVEERVSVLNDIHPSLGNESRRILDSFPRSKAKIDDILDAMAASVTALASPKELRTIPESPPKDSYDLPMEMVYYQPPVTLIL